VATSAESLEGACKMIREIMEKGVPLPNNNNNEGMLSHKLYIDLPDGLNEPQFNLVGKILGPSGKHVKHIYHKSNAKVQLQGKGYAASDVQK